MKPKMMQIQEEFNQLLNHVKGKKLILEIGTALGGTIYEMMKVADPEAEFVSIDIPSGPFSGGVIPPEIKVMESWMQPKQKLHVIREDSRDYRTVMKVKKILNNRKFDFAFIDGDHTFAGVKGDYDIYRELVDGEIALHDIVDHKMLNVGVHILWKELEGVKTEYINDPNQTWAGIGVIKSII